MKRTVTIVNFGMGNLASVANAVRSLDHIAHVSTDPEEVANASKLIVPGVGAFHEGMKNIVARDLREPILQAVARGTHVLGICLGMQMFMRRSFEFEVQEGFSLFEGDVERIDAESFGLRLPHIGWNATKFCSDHPILAGIPDGHCFYYLNSYVCVCDDDRDVLAKFEYARPYVGAIAKDNVVGVQFHPEKSQTYGLRLLKNFIEG